MTIILNGKHETVSGNQSLSDLLSQKQIDLSRIVIEHNGEIINKDSVAGIILQENDFLEILHFVGGG